MIINVQTFYRATLDWKTCWTCSGCLGGCEPCLPSAPRIWGAQCTTPMPSNWRWYACFFVGNKSLCIFGSLQIVICTLPKMHRVLLLNVPQPTFAKFSSNLFWSKAFRTILFSSNPFFVHLVFVHGLFRPTCFRPNIKLVQNK